MNRACLLAVAAVAGLMTAVACDANVGQTTGSGNVKTETRTVSGFDSVDVNGAGTLNITQSGTESLTVTADDNILPMIHSDVSGGTLSLGPQSVTLLNSTQLTYTLTVRSLKQISAHGATSVSASGLNTSSLSVTMDGAPKAQLSGQAQSQDIHISGTGQYDASGLSSRTANVQIDGVGNAVLAVSDSLSADVSPAGKVEYIGSPSVKHSGMGSVSRR